MDVLNLIDSNNLIINLINNNKPFTVIRIGAELLAAQNINIRKCTRKDLISLSHDAGIYSKNNIITDYDKFYLMYTDAIKNSDALAFLNMKNYLEIQLYYCNTYNLLKLYSRSLEPFYICQEEKLPWSHHLLGKKVLIINPFVDSFQKQLKINFKFLKIQQKKSFMIIKNLYFINVIRQLQEIIYIIIG